MKNTLKALALALSLSGLAHAGTVSDVAKHGSATNPLQQMLSLRRLYQQFVKNDTPLAQAYFVL